MFLPFRDAFTRLICAPVLVVLLLNPASLFSQTIRILPLGNSITYGTNMVPDPDTPTHPAYRKKLKDLLVQAGYSVDLIGSRSSGYQLFSDAQHCGLPGITNDDLASVLETGYNPHFAYQNYEAPGPYLQYYPPDMILLEIGTNDVINGDIYDLGAMTDIFNAIDAYESSSGKTILVLVAKIISTEASNGQCNQDGSVNIYNSNLVSLVNNRINAGDKLVLVDMQCGAGINYATDMLDTYHPNPAGYEKMGQAWFNMINSFNTAPTLTPIPNQTVPEGSPFASIYLDNYVDDSEDPDADITWTISPSSPVYYNMTVTNRVVTLTPKDPEWGGQEVLTFTATDKGHVIDALRKSSSCQATFKVTAVNDLPSITMPTLRTIDVNNLYAVVISAHDDDPGDMVVLSAPTKPSWLNFNAATSTLYGTPLQADAGNAQVVIRATDGKAVVDSVMTIIVIPMSSLSDINQSAFKVFPNPAGDYFTVSCENESITGLNLFDLSGKLVFTRKIISGIKEITIGTPDLPAGLYMVHIITEDNVYYSKIEFR